MLPTLLPRNGFSPPAACPWLPARDVHLAHEQHKEGRPGHWRCTYNDSKAFRTEAHLDMHMRNRHVAEVPTVRAGETTPFFMILL